jgi:hypothetical protein
MEHQKCAKYTTMAKGEKVESNHGDSDQQSMHFDKLTFG